MDDLFFGSRAKRNHQQAHALARLLGQQGQAIAHRYLGHAYEIGIGVKHWGHILALDIYAVSACRYDTVSEVRYGMSARWIGTRVFHEIVVIKLRGPRLFRYSILAIHTEERTGLCRAN